MGQEHPDLMRAGPELLAQPAASPALRRGSGGRAASMCWPLHAKVPPPSDYPCLLLPRWPWPQPGAAQIQH